MCQWEFALQAVDFRSMFGTLFFLSVTFRGWFNYAFVCCDCSLLRRIIRTLSKRIVNIKNTVREYSSGWYCATTSFQWIYVVYRSDESVISQHAEQTWMLQETVTSIEMLKTQILWSLFYQTFDIIYPLRLNQPLREADVLVLNFGK